MKSQPNRDYCSNDCVMTPEDLVKRLIAHFQLQGKILEPCKGSGNFLRYLPIDTLWCEIDEGRDFFDFHQKVDWIITNPPWSKMRAFLKHAMEIANNVCFLMTINHIWTKARLRDMKEAGFGIKEIVIFETPKEFPQLGFQMGMVYLCKGYVGDIKFGEL